MLLTRLEAEGIFSFGVDADRFALNLNDGLTVIVGPNASGKSNIGRALDLVKVAMRFENAAVQEARSALFAVLEDHARGARHDRMQADAPSTIRLSIRLAGSAEATLMTSYLQVLVLSAIFSNQTVDQASLPALEAWVAAKVTTEAITDLLEGTIVISHSGVPGTQWSVSYEFDHEGVPLTWHINTSIPNLTNTIAPRTRTPVDGPPTVLALTQRLVGEVRPPPGTILPPEQPFRFEALLPGSDGIIRLEMGTLNVNVAPAPHRTLVTSIGVPIPAGDPLGPYRRSYSLASVLSTILDRSLLYLGPAAGSLGRIAWAREAATYGMGADEADLTTRLHTLKNGDQVAQARYQEVQVLFEALAPGNRFELNTQPRTGPDGAKAAVTEIEVFPCSADRLRTIARPLQFAGAGVEQALIIAEALVGEPERVLLLDEPATNLHPAWQRIVRAQLGSRRGQCLMVTHSPYLMPVEGRDQLAAVVRFSIQGGATRVHRLSETDLTDRRWVDTMIKELAWSADARGLLFAAGVVLLEGPTEQAALPTWFAKSETASRFQTPDDLHVAFYSVGGHLAFQAFISYLERFGVPWAVICDGAAFRFDNGKHIFRQVLEAGADEHALDTYLQQEGIITKEQHTMTAQLFRSMITAGAANGIFTLAPGWHHKREPEGDQESFEAFVASIPELNKAAGIADKESSRSKPRAGRILAERTACPDVVNQLYGDILSRLWKKRMPKLRG